MSTPSDERFCSKYSARFPVSNKSTLVYSATDKSARIVPHNLALLLDRCFAFRTLEQHVQDWANVIRRGGHRAEIPDMESIRKHVSALAADGFLISEKAVLAVCQLPLQPPQTIASVGIVTRDRTESMDSCLRSFIENSKKYGRTNDFVVLDDSEVLLSRARTRERLLSLKQEYDVEISYAGREEKLKFAESLVSEGGFDRALVDFALINSGGHEFSCGKNRNALFLQTIGELTFSTDDDAVCRSAVPPESESQLEQERRGQPLTPIEFWFFADRQETLNSAIFVEEDLLATHERLLGRGLGECLAESGDISLLSLEQPISHHLRALESGNDRVFVTLTGMIGDSGIRVPVTHKVLNHASRQRLIASKETYLTGRLSREVLRVATRPCISNRTWFVTTALGYDNRELLPPFFPVLRGTDGIFAATLSRCNAYGYVADVPRAILHAPRSARSYNRDAIMQAARGITMNALVIACLNSLQLLPGINDNAERMRMLGRHLVEIGSMKLEGFEEFIRLRLWREQGNAMANLEKDLSDYQNPPAYWTHDLEGYLTEMRASLTRPEYVVPMDLRDSHGIEPARELSRKLITKFGHLLCHWPDMIEAATKMRAKGQRLAVPV